MLLKTVKVCDDLNGIVDELKNVVDKNYRFIEAIIFTNSVNQKIQIDMSVDDNIPTDINDKSNL